MMKDSNQCGGQSSGQGQPGTFCRHVWSSWIEMGKKNNLKPTRILWDPIKYPTHNLLFIKYFCMTACKLCVCDFVQVCSCLWVGLCVFVCESVCVYVCGCVWKGGEEGMLKWEKSVGLHDNPQKTSINSETHSVCGYSLTKHTTSAPCNTHLSTPGSSDMPHNALLL